jgi:hypothetical protein
MTRRPRAAVAAALAGIVMLISGDAFSDSPIIAGDEPDMVESKNHQFFAVPSPNGKSTIVYRRRKPHDEELWRMPHWYLTAFLSDDGEYLTTGYPGNNLLDLDCAASTPMLQFYRRGTLVKTVALGEILRSLKSLQRTVSHFAWGFYRGHLSLHTVAVDTLEGNRLSFDVTTGALVRTEPIKLP